MIRPRAIVSGALACALVSLGGVARAQSASPTVPPAPRIDGEVSGDLSPGGTLRIRCDVMMPGGWQALHLVEVVVHASGRDIERLTYEVESSRLVIGGSRVLAGTGAEGSGTYLEVRGPRVIVTTGGPYLSIEIDADVLRALPPDARFRLSATSDAGMTVDEERALADGGESHGFGWDVVFASIAAALLVGGFAGNLVASRRRPPPRLSVYGVIQRRLDASPPRREP